MSIKDVTMNLGYPSLKLAYADKRYTQEEIAELVTMSFREIVSNRHQKYPDNASNRCNACVFYPCGKDASDPDCYPYGQGCEEHTGIRRYLSDYLSDPNSECDF